MLRHLRIQSKLFVVVLIPVLVLAAVAALVFNVFDTVKVTGGVYNEIANQKDLEADILPPPAFALESYANALELATLSTKTAGRALTAAEQKQQADVIGEITAAQKLFDERYAFWKPSFKGADMASTSVLLDGVHVTGDAFYDVLVKELLPAVQAGKTETVTQLAEFRLLPLYETHRAAVVKLADVSVARQAALTDHAAKLVSNRKKTIAGAMIAAALGMIVIGLVVARRISAPLKLMTRQAAEIAATGLPESIATINNLPADAPIPDMRAFNIVSKDEVGELAEAFNAVHASALNLAAQQVRQNRNYGENLITIGRRNQGLVFRTLGLITELESNERDPGTLENLFRLDALTTRMRRQAESLLVLAGDKPASSSGAPVDVSDVIRGALSEVDDYQRVDHGDMQPIMIQGRFVHSVVHLFAELIENAITYSPPTSRVTLQGRVTSEGYQIAIVDRGLGMSPKELDDVNHRLANPSSFDLSPVRVLGHHVVSKLSERLNIRVYIHENLPDPGVTASVLIPVHVLVVDELDPRLQASLAPGVAAPTSPTSPTTELDRRSALRNDVVETRSTTNGDYREPSLAEQIASHEPAPILWEPEPAAHQPQAEYRPAVAFEDSFASTKQVESAAPQAFRTNETVSLDAPWTSAPVHQPIQPGYQFEPIEDEYRSTTASRPYDHVEADARYGTSAGRDGFDSELPCPHPDERIPNVPAPGEAEAGRMTKTGFRKRVKGAQAPDTGPAAETVVPERDAAALRSSLAGLQSGFDRAKRS